MSAKLNVVAGDGKSRSMTVKSSDIRRVLRSLGKSSK